MLATSRFKHTQLIDILDDTNISFYYSGSLSKPSNPIVTKAYNSLMNQKARCYNTNNPDYQYYGAIGIKVVWKTREFIGWYITEYLKRPSWHKPVVSRTGDIGNYELGNCSLVEASENSALVRAPSKQKQKSRLAKAAKVNSLGVKFVNVKTGKCLKFDSGIAAGLFIGKDSAYISYRRDNPDKTIKYKGKTYYVKTWNRHKCKRKHNNRSKIN